MKLLDRLKKKMRKEVGDIYDVLCNLDLPIEGVFAPYFVTLFLYSTPIEIAERIIDWFLYKGEKFLLEMTIRMLKMRRQSIFKLLGSDSAAFEIQVYLSKHMVEDWCSDTTIKSILNKSQLSSYNNFIF